MAWWLDIATKNAYALAMIGTSLVLPAHHFVHADFMKPKTWSFMAFLDLLFDGVPHSGYTFSTFTNSATMAHLMHRSGAFDSNGSARRNGWNKPVPHGFSEHVIAKRRVVVILNVFDGWDDPNED
jgi:hypothetical protein